MQACHTPPWALGFDAGSVALKVVITDLEGNVRARSYTPTRGRPVETALRVLSGVLEKEDTRTLALVVGTGSAGRLLCQLLGVPFVNEVIAHSTAVRHLHPEARAMIEMGGQDAKLVLFGDGDGRILSELAISSSCAAGTGSFLDQQASRLGIRIEEEFGELALRSTHPPRVAGRCSVFAKSDMIHLQQQATPLQEIVAGLCMGLARNLKSNIGRGMDLPRPVAFCGGVASNRGVVHAIQEVFGLGREGLLVPEAHAVTGALGAILAARAGTSQHREIDLRKLEEHLAGNPAVGHRIEPLRAPSNGRPAAPLPTRAELRALAAGGPVDAWLGLDVGSISTKIALVDARGRVLAKTYRMTNGRPLDAVQRVLREIGDEVGGLVRIRGAATTGSGRYLTGDFIGADLVVNEITAQAAGAESIDPQVDTIFEIGGQDSKYIRLDRGVVVDFEMNHACAAGTGSFLEEQAERLGIRIEGEFGRLALRSRAPVRLGERCTVFMESDLLGYQQQGVGMEDLVSGLAYSIVTNYLNRVVGRRRIGSNIFFQGGTAFNPGVVAAFERVTGRTVTVPPHHEVTGAIGAALLVRRGRQRDEGSGSRFGGFELASRQVETRSFECNHCENSCEINEVRSPERDPLFYGSRCDRYNVKRERGERSPAIPNLFAERWRLLVRHAHLGRAPCSGQPRIALPMGLMSHQLLPLWGTLLGEMGLHVELGPVANAEIIRRGIEAVLATPCFPVKVAHGHVLDSLSRGADHVWLPSILAMKPEFNESVWSRLCPYVTAFPYQIGAVLEGNPDKDRILTPVLRLDRGTSGLIRGLLPVARRFGVGRRRLRRAVERAWAAQEAFETACRERGREVLDALPPEMQAVVVVSRPYNGCDAAVSLDIPGKLRRFGVCPMPLDFLDLRDQEAPEDVLFRNMYWKYGQRILHAAAVIRRDPRLHAVYLSNFGCGPDSFLVEFFKRVMSPKPALVMEIDEHSADGGVLTRLEAFLESLRSAPAPSPEPRSAVLPHTPVNLRERTLYVPYMGDTSRILAAAYRASGQPAELMEPAGRESIDAGWSTCSGKECLPCIMTSGDLVRTTRSRGFDPARAAFLMPTASGPCRFGQYHARQRMILGDLGMPEVPVVAISQEKRFWDSHRDLPRDPLRLAWIGWCAVDILLEALHAVRPYETEKGSADRVYEEWIRRLTLLIEQYPTDERIAKWMGDAAAAFSAIPVVRSPLRPLIGVVGEIYLRLQPLSNSDVLRELERLGAECRVAGSTEWFYYTNWTRMEEARISLSLRPLVQNWIRNRFQRGMHRRLHAPFATLLGPFHEPTTADLLRLARPYLDSSVEGEAVLTVGKAITYHRDGFDGVLNLMPFSCMPSTIASGVLKRLMTSLGGMPILTLVYDGQQDPTMGTRIEAFLHQARAHREGRTGKLA